MAINKKLIHFEKRENFNARLANNEINDTSIVFIQDTGELWTHGLFFCTTATNLLEAPSLLTVGDTIAVQIGDKTSNYIVPPAALKGRTMYECITATTDTRGHWTGTIPGVTELYDGLVIHVRFSTSYYGNSEGYNTLDINNLGPKLVWYRYNSILTTHWGSNAEVTLTYRTTAGSYKIDNARGELTNGTTYTDGWVADYAYYTYSDRFAVYYYFRFLVPSVASGDEADGYIGRYMLVMRTPNNKATGLTLTNNSTATTKSMYTGPLLLGEIYYYNNTNTYAAGANFTHDAYMRDNSGLVDFRYTFNCGSTLTAYKPMLLVGTMSNGYFYMDTTLPWTLEWPSTDDGKVYILIGQVYDTYRGELSIYNPAYVFKNGKLLLYSLYAAETEWDNITGKPSTFTPSTHTHPYTDLTGSTTTADLAIVSSGTANGWTLKTLGSNAFNSTAYLPLAGGTMTGPINWGTGSTREVLLFSTNSTWKAGLRYSWNSNTTVALWGKHKNTQFVWNAGADSELNGTTTKTYDFLIGRDTSGTYNDTVVGRIAGNIIWHAGNDGSDSGLDADLLDGKHAADFALSNHLYHKLTVNENYYESYSGENLFSIVTKNFRYDNLRFKSSTITDVQYWNYTTNEWQSWSKDLSPLFNGSGETNVYIPKENRKFRFCITSASGWPAIAMFVLLGNYHNAGTFITLNGNYSNVIIETRNSDTEFVEKASFGFSTSFMGTNARVLSSLHTGDTIYRITIELASWTTENNAALKMIAIFSNYGNLPLQVFRHDGYGNIYPITTSKYALGGSSYRWNGIYAASADLSTTLKVAGAVTFSGLDSGTSDVIDGTEFLTSYASANGFSTSGYVGKVYKRPVSKLYNYLKGKFDTLYLGINTPPSQIGTSTIGATDRPIYLSSGTPTQTTYRMAGTNATATTARAISDNLETGIWYVNRTYGIYNINDGAAYVNKYSDLWIAEIYLDYRTGQIALRGKNNGTWQAWRKVLDSSNFNTWAPTLDGTGATGTWGIGITGNAATATEFASAQSVTLTGDTTGTASSKAGWSIATTTKYLTGTSSANYELATTAMTTAMGNGKVTYYYKLTNNTTGLFAATSNANSIFAFNKHDGSYDSQLGFSSNGNIYYRNFANVAPNTTQAWKQIAFTDSNITGQASYAANVGSAGTLGTNYVAASKVIAACNWYDTVTGSDTDSVINRWDEIVNFVSGFEETPDLATYLANNYLAKTGNSTSSPMTGTIYVKDVNPLVLLSTNLDLDIWRVTGDNASNAWDNAYGFYLRYNGTGNTNDNSLSLWANNQTGNDVEVYRVKLDGILNFLKAPTINGTAISLTTHDHDDRYLKLIGGTLTGALNLDSNTMGAVAHLTFNREWSYLQNKASGGKFAFLANNAAVGASANADLIIDDGSIYPGTSGHTSLGLSTRRFNQLHLNGALAAYSTVYFRGLTEGTGDVTDDTELVTSYADTSGFANANGAGQAYRRKATKLYNYIKGKTDSIYVQKAGDTITGHMTYASDKTNIFIQGRKKEGSGGWAYAPVTCKGDDGVTFFGIGAFGAGDTFNYAYLGTGTYDATNNLRIYSDKIQFGTNVIVHAGNYATTTDTRYITSVGVTDDETNYPNTLRYVKNGVSNYFTVPFATNADTVDGYHETSFFRSRGVISNDYVDLTTYTSNAEGYINPENGIWYVQRSGHSDALITFTRNGNDSTSGLDILFTYTKGGLFKFRRRIDGNRLSGDWEKFITDLNYTTYCATSNHNHDNTYVKKIGDTITGLIQANTPSGQEGSFSEARTGGASVFFGVGTGNKNHGVYSKSLSKWLIYADSSDTTNKTVYVNNTSIPASATLITTSNIGSYNAGTATNLNKSTLGYLYLSATTTTGSTGTVTATSGKIGVPIQFYGSQVNYALNNDLFYATVASNAITANTIYLGDTIKSKTFVKTSAHVPTGASSSSSSSGTSGESITYTAGNGIKIAGTLISTNTWTGTESLFAELSNPGSYDLIYIIED